MKLGIKSLYASAGVMGVVGLLTVAGASAATSTTTSSSGIPRATLRTDRAEAIASELGTTPADLKTTLKSEKLKALVASKNLTMKQFHTDVKAKVTSELEAQGYTSTQVTTALSHSHRTHEHKK